MIFATPLVFILSLLTPSANQLREIVPREGEAMIPWNIATASAHPFLQFRERHGGLLQDSQQFADVSDGYQHHHGPLNFWQKTTLLRSTPKTGLRKRGVHYFFCTVYYTPYESAFVKELGYDTTPTSKRGLGGRKYGRSFLKASMMEGFGKLKTPVGGKKYIKFDGKWGYANRILGNRNNTLIDRKSAAMHRKHPYFKKNTRLTILDPQLYNVFGSIEWNVDDTGFGLHISQLDLYWGEDYPFGPGKDTTRPAGTRFQKSWIVPVLIEQ